MYDSVYDPSGRKPAARDFRTTCWQMVASAGGDTSNESQQALTQLCEQYWYPLYAYIRRSGHRADQAEDLTQAFFAMLLEKKSFKNADPSRGRFRSYLLGALKNFLCNESDRARALKRGGGRGPLSLDVSSGEGRYAIEPADSRSSPERLFDRQWALTVLSHALKTVKDDLARQGKQTMFDRLQFCLVGDDAGADYRKIGEELGMNEGAIKTAVHRLRKRYRDALREQIAQTLDSEDEVEEEIQYLFAALKA